MELYLKEPASCWMDSLWETEEKTLYLKSMSLKSLNDFDIEFFYATLYTLFILKQEKSRTIIQTALFRFSLLPL